MRRVVLVGLTLASCAKPQDDRRFQAALAAIVRDPQTTQFRDVSENARTICGQLNTKNAYGAYSGFLIFVYDRNENTLLVEQEDASFETKEKLEIKLDLCKNRDDLMPLWIGHRVARS
jgi:hypothetical protein